MANRIEATIAEGHRRTAELIAALPEGSNIRRESSKRVAEVCARLIAGSPINEPTSVAISHLGRKLYGDFPSSQTLLNGYRDLLKIWREIYSAVVSASLPKIRGAHQGSHEGENGPLDAGDRASMAILLASLRETRLENDRLKKLIHDAIPISDDASIVTADLPHRIDLDALAGWLEDVCSGISGLQADEKGLVVGRTARPGFRVMSKKAFESIKAIVKGPTETA